MKKYNVTVNGNRYEVEVEEVDGKSEKVTQVSKPEPVKTPKPKIEKSKTEETKTEKPSLNSEGETIKAPMPGSIVDVLVSVGETVSEGDTLLILEAMKMDNEIMATRDGKITEVNVSKGQTVNAGDSLISLE